MPLVLLNNWVREAPSLCVGAREGIKAAALLVNACVLQFIKTAREAVPMVPAGDEGSVARVNIGGEGV